MSEAPPDVEQLTATGAEAHYRRLEALYRSAPVNRQFESEIEIAGPGQARIRFKVEESSYHAAGAAHGTLYFKMLDDVAFYAANSLISDRFLLTTAFNLHFTRPMRAGACNVPKPESTRSWRARARARSCATACASSSPVSPTSARARC